jgi:hypothetical protein
VLQYQYGALTFPAVTGTAALSLTQGGDWQVNDSGRRIGLDPADDRYGAFGRLSYDVADGITVFGEASYNRDHIVFNAGPNLQTGITLRSDNAYLINTLGRRAADGHQHGHPGDDRGGSAVPRRSTTNASFSAISAAPRASSTCSASPRTGMCTANMAAPNCASSSPTS